MKASPSRDPEAFPKLLKANELRPDDPEILRERSKVLAGLGKNDESSALAKRANELAGAFAVLGSKNQPEQEFASFADAVDNAPDGATIEVRGNGPFSTTPVVVKGRSLTIRAKAL